MINSLLEKDALQILSGLGELNSKFSGRRILLTGASGFIGCQFMHYFVTLNNSGLLKEPCTLLAVDNFMRARPKWINNLDNQSNVSVIEKDITSKIEYGSLDYIIHAASIASPPYYRKHPIETIDANVTGIRNLLDYCKDNPVESLLFFSTSEIYGDPDAENIPTKEDYRGFVSCTGPRACYDESKRLGETLCVNYWRIHEIPVKIVRPFNNYGPGIDLEDKRVIPDFFKDVIHGEDIKILSDGKPTRTFCYITDAIEGYLRLLLSNHNGESFNIGTEKPEITMFDLANQIIEISNKDLKVIFEKDADLDYLVDNPSRRCPSIDKARSLLGFSPKVNLEEGLKRTYEYYKLSPEGEVF